MAPGLKAGMAAFANSNRYSPNGEHAALIRAIAKMENLPEDHIVAYAGSGEILARTVVAFCSPTKPFVQADPSYDSPQRVAKRIGVPVTYLPLTSDYRHDVKAMLAANPNAGVYYVVNPNNPTGTMTPMSEIEWLVDNKPAGAIVLIDETYIHWSKDYPNNTCTHLVRSGKEVVLTRTFSKVFGMAGVSGRSRRNGPVEPARDHDIGRGAADARLRTLFKRVDAAGPLQAMPAAQPRLAESAQGQHLFIPVPDGGNIFLLGFCQHLTDRRVQCKIGIAFA